MECPFRSLWNAIAEAIRSQVNPDTFQRWFADIELVATDEESLTLRVPNHIYQLWIESNYQQLVQSSVVSILGQPRRIKFVHGDGATASGGSDSRTPSVETVRETASSKTSKALAVPAIPTEPDGPVAANGMNPRNTFDSFVVGANNQFAHAAAVAVAQALARTYNPLFVYGGVGLGKTHLMQAIGQYVLGHKKGIKVVYLSSEKFTNEFIDAIQQSTLVKFRKKYRQADLLLIDDIQFLAGRERTQEEFFHTFNTLFEGHKQIVLSSDRPASEIQNLENRLVSRFEWGLTAELQAPDIETRLAILRKKAGALGVKLEGSVMEFLAERIRTNVRRLEGALLRVASFASLSGKELNRDSIEHLLKDILHEEARKTVTVDQIQRKVAEHYDIRVADMTSKRRPANIAFPRQVAMYLARELTQSSLSEIGEAFGGRDHGTVLHACKLVKGKIAAEEATRRVVSLIDSQLKR
ncbi:MAG TPA: chromosomal replication initiator protein DnaA [Chthoniobacterales bacterium]